MKFIINLPFLFIVYFNTSAQSDVWNAYWNSDSSKFGFKDAKGRVKIEPRFEQFSIAQKFKNIIMAVEDSGGHYKTYYLNKSGKIFGADSLYFFDNTPDCESEGFIRFKDVLNDKIGLFNKYGNIVIPPVYNWMEKVENGLLIALRGATKKYLDEYDEHYNWEDGTVLLIDTANNVLIENFPENVPLNLYSIKKKGKADADSIRTSIRSVDGNYYSFINFEKEFSVWLKNLLLNLNNDNLRSILFESVAYCKDEAWKFENKTNILKNHLSIIKAHLSQLNTNCSNYNIFIDELNSSTYDASVYGKYYDNCNQSMRGKYPVMNVYITDEASSAIIDEFEFLRTENGYKLISVCLKKNSF